MESEKQNKTFWFDLIRVELDAMSEEDLIEPDTEIGEGETVVGVMPLDLRKLYTRREQVGAEMLRFVVDSRSARNEKERQHASAKASQMQDRAKLYLEIMWMCLRDELRLWSGGTIGVRKGWKVVRNVRLVPSSPLDFLRGLFDQ